MFQYIRKNDKNNPFVKKIIDKARVELGYSDKTIKDDIIRTIHKIWSKIE